MSRNRKHIRQSVGRTPRKATRHTPKVTKPRLVIDLSGRKQRKQLHKNRDLIRRQIISERKRDRRSSNSSSSNNNNKKGPSALRNLILYPPVPPPPAPSNLVRQRQKQKQQQQQQKQQLKFDTITVIDSEDEGVGSSGQDAIPIFYEDRTGGFDEKDVPVYNSRCGEDGMMLEKTLEEGEIPEEEDGGDLNRAIVNVEEIAIEEEDDVIEVDDTVTELTVPLPKNEDQSVIFCSEVIDLSRAVDRNKLLDYIPIGYDPEPAEARQRSPRKKHKKVRADGKQTEQQQETTGQSTAAKEDARITKRMVVIDGNNVAFGHTIGQAFSVKGLEICIQYFKKMGHNVKAVVPQFRLKRGKSTDQKRLEDLYKAGDVLLAPSKNLPGQTSSSYDDRLIISVAETFDAIVISNDNFRDLLTESDSWKKIIETRVVGYTWVMDAFFLPDDPYGRHGPKLKDLLECKAPTVVAATEK